MQTELARVADCAGEEMESSVRRGSLFKRLQLVHCSGTRWLVVALPGIAELDSVLLCSHYQEHGGRLLLGYRGAGRKEGQRW